MSEIKPAYLNEAAAHGEIIKIINEEAFGPGRHVRAAERVREQGPHDPLLSFVASVDDMIVGSVRLTPVMAGGLSGHLLGPLAVRPVHKNLGIGRQLVRIAVDAARQAGSEGVVLVGDLPYYGPMGFEPIKARLVFPGPVDPARVLVAPSGTIAHDRMRGKIAWRANEAAPRSWAV